MGKNGYLDNEHTPTACVDLDGTIASYKDGWQSEEHYGEPIPGVQEALQRLKDNGWRIIIFTTRGDNKRTSAYLKKHNIPFDYINENPDQPPGTSDKLIADVYIDDRGIRFNGDWAKTIDEVLAFSPWEKKEGELGWSN